MNFLITQWWAVLSRPGDAGLVADGEEQSELLVKKFVVVPEIKAEKRIGLSEGTASRHNLGPSTRDQVERGKLLKTLTGSAALKTVTALANRILFVRAAAAARRTTGAESRNSSR